MSNALLPANILCTGISLTSSALGIWLIPKTVATPTLNRVNSSIPTKKSHTLQKNLHYLERKPLENLISDSIQKKAPYTEAQIECAEKLGIDPSECDTSGFKNAITPLPSDKTLSKFKREVDYAFSPALPPKLAVTFEYFPKKTYCDDKTYYQETTPNLTDIIQPAIDYWNNARIQANIVLNRPEKQAMIGILKHPFSTNQLTIPIGICNCPDDIAGTASPLYICIKEFSSRLVAHEFGHIFGFEHPTHDKETVMNTGTMFTLAYRPCNIDPLHPFSIDIERMKKNEIPIKANTIRTKGEYRTVEGELNLPRFETCVFIPIEHLIGKGVLRQTPGCVITLFTSLVYALFLALKGTEHALKNHPHLQKLIYLPTYILYVALSFGINGPLFGSVSGSMILGTTLIQKSLDIPSIKKTILPDKSSPTRKKLFTILNHPAILPVFFATFISNGQFGSHFKSLPSIPSMVTLATESVIIVLGFLANIGIGIIMGRIIAACHIKALDMLNNDTKMIQNESANQANSTDLEETTSAV